MKGWTESDRIKYTKYTQENDKQGAEYNNVNGLS